MARKRKSIVLQKLPPDSKQFISMLADLCGKSGIAFEAGASALWSQRFAASGKNQCTTAPRIRL